MAIVASACSSSNQKPTLEAADTPTQAVEKADRNACTDPIGPDVNLVAQAKDSVPKVPVYSDPTSPQPAQSLANPKLYNDDPNAPVPLVFLVKEAPTDRDCQWLNVYLAQRPNGSTGWIKRADVQVSAHEYRMEAHLSDFRLKVFNEGKLVHDWPIAVAEDDTPTPGGLFYTNMLLKPPDPNGDYGPYAFGLSGFSEKLTSFNGGDGQLGMHGTNRPEKIGTKVSHGCIRLENDNISALAKQLPLGVPVKIYA